MTKNKQRHEPQPRRCVATPKVRAGLIAINFRDEDDDAMKQAFERGLVSG